MMDALGVSQADLAKKIGICQPDLSKALRAERILTKADFILRREYEAIFGKDALAKINALEIPA